jgi:hypothetical protein
VVQDYNALSHLSPPIILSHNIINEGMNDLTTYETFKNGIFPNRYANSMENNRDSYEEYEFNLTNLTSSSQYK